MPTRADLRALQGPIKQRYRDDPAAALDTMTVRGTLNLEQLVCRVETGHGPVSNFGLHRRTGGDGQTPCAAQTLLEALVGCAGVTACAVISAMGLPVTGGAVVAEGDLDYRGTLGVSRDVPVGFLAIRVRLELESSAAVDELSKLGPLVERYCVVAQSLRTPLTITVQA